MNRRTMTVMTVGLALAALVAGGALAARGGRGGGPDGPGCGPGGPGCGPMMGECLRQLDLTPEQEQALRAGRFAQQRRMIELRSQLQLKRLDLRAEMENDKPDQKKVMALAGEIAELRGRMMKAGLEHRLQMRSQLTPEQFAKCRELCRQGRMGARGPDGGAADGRPGCGPGARARMGRGPHPGPGFACPFMAGGPDEGDEQEGLDEEEGLE